MQEILRGVSDLMSAQCATVTSMIKTTSSSSAAIAKMLFI